MPFPIPNETPCESTAYTTITLTLPNCEEYWWILIGLLYELTEQESYDTGDDVQDVIDIYQDMIDLAIYASSP